MNLVDKRSRIKARVLSESLCSLCELVFSFRTFLSFFSIFGIVFGKWGFMGKGAGFCFC